MWRALSWGALLLTGASAWARPVEFNRDVRPILSANCFFCHGPDKNKRKAGLRLDVREVAVGEKAIVPGQPTLVLSHNPDVQDLPMWDGVRAWVLAGHTHGGQVKPPFLPPPILPVMNRRYVAGEYTVGPGRTLYINRGLGHLTQVRFNCRPELTLFTLQRAPTPTT